MCVCVLQRERERVSFSSNLHSRRTRTSCCVVQKRKYYGLERRSQLVFGVASYSFGVSVCFSFILVDSFLGTQRAEKIKLQIRYVHMNCRLLLLLLLLLRHQRDEQTKEEEERKAFIQPIQQYIVRTRRKTKKDEVNERKNTHTTSWNMSERFPMGKCPYIIFNLFNWFFFFFLAQCALGNGFYRAIVAGFFLFSMFMWESFIFNCMCDSVRANGQYFKRYTMTRRKTKRST